MRTEVKIGLLVCVIAVGVVAGYLMIFPGPDEVASNPEVPPSVPPAAAEPEDTTSPATGAPVIPRITIGPRIGAPDPAAAPKAPAPTTRPAPAAGPVVAAPPRAGANLPLVIDGESAPMAVPAPPVIATPVPTPTGGIRLGPSPVARPPSPTANLATAGSIRLSSLPQGRARTYTVRADDNGFWVIARRPEVYGAGRYEYLIRKANPGVDTRRLRPGMTLTIPPLPVETASAVRVAGASAASTPRPDGSAVHVVREGDDFWTLAAEYLGNGSRFELIARANPGVDPGALQIGQKIIIPKAPAAGATAAPARLGQPAIAAGPGQTVYTIASGDVLSTIARTHYGDGNLWPAIVKANPGLNPDTLGVGRKILLPSKAEAERQAGIARRDNTAAMGPSARASASPSGAYVPGRPLFD